MITTFYSFKGGVGRSSVLLETAAQLARQGRSVLVWDLDLEAPGIQKVPALRAVDAAVTAGTLDLLLEFQDSEYRLNEESLGKAIVDLPSNEIARASGRLSFLLPGKIDNNYATRFASIDWNALFAPSTGPGSAFFHRICRLLSEKYGFEHILIDSRTGFTDLGAVCTLQLPDFVVLVFNLNEQNVDAIARTWNVVTQTEARNGGKIPVFTVANMIPFGLTDVPKARRPAITALLEEKVRTLERTLPIHLKLALRSARFITDAVPTLDGDEDEAREHAPIASRLETHRRELIASEAGGAQRGERASAFKERVASLFALLGYSITRDYRVNGAELDLRLAMEDTAVPSYVLVECKDTDHPISQEDITKLAQQVDKASQADRHRYQAMLVARSRFADNAREVAGRAFVHLLTYDELLLSLVDFGPELERTVHEFQGTALERLYVDQDVLLESELRPDTVAAPRPLTDYATEWLARPGSNFLALLGDFGSGKTSFAKRFAAMLAVQAREKPGGRIPVMIDLRRARSSTVSLENILASHFQGLSPRPFNPAALMHLNREGCLLLIFDGLDEMLGYVEPIQLVDNLRQIVRAAEGKAKVLLTCRTHYFRSRPEELGLVHTEHPEHRPPEGATPLFETVQSQPETEIAYLLEFSDEKVREYLRKALPPPNDAEAFREDISRTYNLDDLAVRPFLLELIVRALPQITSRGSGDRVTVAELYRTFCEEWFQKSDFHVMLTRERKEALVEYLARVIWESPERSVHYEALADKVFEFYDEPLSPAEKTKLDYEVRTALFLKRDPRGNYTFIHTSFLEFFIARILRNALRQRDATLFNLKRLTKEVAYFLEQWPEAELIPEVTAEILARPYEPQISENALLLHYWHACAASGPLIGRGVEIQNSPEAIAERRARLRERRPAGVFLEGADLTAMDLTGIDLEFASLREVDLTGAVLRDATFAGSYLRHARLQNADCSGATFDNALLVEADLRRLDGRRASFRKAALLGANLSFGRFTDADFRGAALEGATTTGAGFLRANLEDIIGALDESAGPSDPGPLEPVVALAGWKSVAFHPDGLVLATGGDGVTLWDVDTGAPLKQLSAVAVRGVRWNPTGRYLAATASDRILILDSLGGKSAQEIARKEGGIGVLAWSPDGGKIAFAFMAEPDWLQVHDLGSNTARPIDAGVGAIEAAAWSHDGRYLGIGGAKGVAVVDLKTGSAIRLPNKSVDWLEWGTEGVLFFIEEGRRVATLTGTVVTARADCAGARMAAIDSHSGRLVVLTTRGIESFELETLTLVPGSTHELHATSSDLAATRNHVAICSPRTLWVIDGNTGLERWHVSDSRPSVRARWSDDGAFAAASEHTLTVWTGKRTPDSVRFGGGIGTFRVSHNLRFAAVLGGRTIVSGTVGPNFRPTVEKQLPESVEGVAIDKQLLRIAYGQGQARRVPIVDLLTGETIWTLAIDVRRMAWNASGSRLLAVTRSRDVIIYDVDKRKMIRSIQAGGVEATAMAWNRNESVVALGSSNELVVIELEYNNQKIVHDVQGDPLAWSLDSEYLATGDQKGNVTIWGDRGRTQIRQFRAAENRVLSLSWRADGAALAVSAQREVSIWQISGGEPRRIARIHAAVSNRLIGITENGIADTDGNDFWFSDRWARYNIEDLPERFSFDEMRIAMFGA